MSQFDPNVFLQAQVTEVNTKLPPLPTENPASSDGFYTAIIGKITPASGTISKGDRVGQTWLQMVVPLQLEIPQQLQEGLGYGPSYTLTDRPMIDLTPDGKGIDNGVGKNRGQRMYREATNTNVAGATFSWAQLEGKVVKVQVTQDMYEGSPQTKVKAVFPA